MTIAGQAAASDEIRQPGVERSDRVPRIAPEDRVVANAIAGIAPA
jgi:hypothetical protein